MIKLRPKRVVECIDNGTISAIDQMVYLILFLILVSSPQATHNILLPKDFSSTYDHILISLYTITLIFVCYRYNKRGESRNFVLKYVCLVPVVGLFTAIEVFVLLTVFYFGATMLFLLNILPRIFLVDVKLAYFSNLPAWLMYIFFGIQLVLCFKRKVDNSPYPAPGP